MLMTERAETELFLGKFNILYLHGYPDTRIHMCKHILPFTSRGHPCVLQPDTSVIELQLWVRSPPHQIQIEEDKKFLAVILTTLFEPFLSSLIVQVSWANPNPREKNKKKNAKN